MYPKALAKEGPPPGRRVSGPVAVRRSATTGAADAYPAVQGGGGFQVEAAGIGGAHVLGLLGEDAGKGQATADAGQAGDLLGQADQRTGEDVGHHHVGRLAWQIGGQVSERGVEMAEADLIEHVRRELETVLPGFEGSRCLWASYRVNRAEGRTQSGARPEDVTMRREGHVITAWPTKLALAPLLAVRVAETIDTLCGARGSESGVRQLADDLRRLGLPQPPVARPPWESIEQWNSVH